MNRFASGPAADPYEILQWQFGGDGVAGSHLNVAPLLGAFTGRGVRIGIVDDGFHLAHPDLAGTFAAAPGRDHREGDDDPSAGASDRHGTLIAGLIGARRNGYGIVGLAPEAQLEAHRVGFGAAPVFVYQKALEAQRFVDVSNNSWGFSSSFQDNVKSPAYSGLGAALEAGAALGRGGLGTVFVFAAGSGALRGDAVNYHNVTNARQVVAVAGVDRDSRPLNDQRTGAAILVSAPGAELISTDAPGAAGVSAGDHATVHGSSASAALISSVVALMLEANPALGYRDVQIILAAAARTSAAPAETFAPTAGAWLNGGGPAYSHRLGFGVVDAAAAVRLAAAWTDARMEADLAQAAAILPGPVAIPARGAVSIPIVIEDVIWTERAVLDLDIQHGRIGELRVSLVSPGGVASLLMDRPGARPHDPLDGGTTRTGLDFAFSTVAPLGEIAAGTWTVVVEDLGDRGAGAVVSGRLAVFGAAADDPRALAQVLTDAFADAASVASLRGRDGEDRLIAAALSDGATISIRPGDMSIIAGRAVSTDAGPLIDDLTGGAGSDRLLGNWIANDIRGGPGDDWIEGRNGPDLLIGDDGADSLFGGNGDDTLVGGRGDDRLWGGQGADLFLFREAGGGRSLVFDFRLGEDRIDASGRGLQPGDVTITPRPGRADLALGDGVIELYGVDAAALAAALGDALLL